MKHYLVLFQRNAANFIKAHPKKLVGAIAASFMCVSGFAFAVASFDLAVPNEPVKLVYEQIIPAAISENKSNLNKDILQGLQNLRLYRTEQVRPTDTPNKLFARLGIDDSEAISFVRRNEVAWKALFGRGSSAQVVTAQISNDNKLLELNASWLDKDKKGYLKELIIIKNEDNYEASINEVKAQRQIRAASGIIKSTFFNATDVANVPDKVAKQLTEIFDSEVDFHRGLRKGDKFSIIYETFEAGGQVLGVGKILSASMSNKGKTHEAVWFSASADDEINNSNNLEKGAYFTPNGDSMRRAYSLSPVKVSRITSGFGMRNHPVYGYSREHTGVDYAAPSGTPIHTIGDGVVTFSGVQRGYGNVVYITHANKKHSTVYAHMSKIHVTEGQKVSQGDVIGLVGSTGVSTGPHLHFEFRIDNAPQNPELMLASTQENTQMTDEQKKQFAAHSKDMMQQLKEIAHL